MKKTDTRVQFTKEVLKNALLKILQNKNIDRVTVKELCEEAGINRGTFYLHFSSPQDLLDEIESSFMNDNSYLFSSYMEDASHKKRKEGISNLQNLFRLTLENIELTRVIFGNNGDRAFRDRIKKQMRPEIIKHWSYEMPDLKKEHLDYIFDYVYEGSMSLILNWIEDDGEDKISVEQLANRLDRLGHYAQLACKEFK